MMSESERAVQSLLSRRRLVQGAAAGTVVSLLGGTYLATGGSSDAWASERKDGRRRVPPGQRVLSKLKPMGGDPGDSRASRYQLKVHGLVARPYDLDFGSLRKMGPVKRSLDVHCVTGWSVLGAEFVGVELLKLIERAKPAKGARYLVLEAAHGYTANLRLSDLDERCLATWELDARRLPSPHGGPVRAVVPDRYFWKSPKWLTGLRLSDRDEPGYWERRGYHNRADPWREQHHG